MINTIYLDNAATTKIFSDALEEYNRISVQEYYNSSSVYGGGVKANRTLKTCRENLANLLKVKPDNVFFTSGGTESNNLAILGGLNKAIKRFICSSCEHPAVYNVALSLKDKIEVVFIACGKDGRVDENKLAEALSDNVPSYVSIMQVNNEAGGINDIERLAKLVKKYNASSIFHSDGVQGFLKCKLDLTDIDYYSFSSHKIHGPKGVGGLYIKNPNKVKSIVYGGGQEKNIRSGTENLPAIAAFTMAANIYSENFKLYKNNFAEFKQIFISSLSKISDVVVNSSDYSSAHILSVSVGGLKGEVILHTLEQSSIYIGKGSACSSKQQISRPLREMGILSEGTIRISFGAFNTKEDIIKSSEILSETILTLRKVFNK